MKHTARNAHNALVLFHSKQDALSSIPGVKSAHYRLVVNLEHRLLRSSAMEVSYGVVLTLGDGVASEPIAQAARQIVEGRVPVTTIPEAHEGIAS